MNIKTLNRGESQIAMDEWIGSFPDLPSIDEEWLSVRSQIQAINEQVRNEATSGSDQKYYIDVHVGLMLYEYLWKQKWFSMRAAANDGFWRFLSLKVAPDVVAQRWRKDNSEHYWSKPTRIWLRSVWWYIHLSWQGSLQATRQLLECDFFSTDTILNFVERNGRKGTCVDAYRSIINYYSKVNPDVVKQYSRGKGGKSDDLFRVVMKLNTAKMMVMEPALYAGGVEGYAESLFRDAGVEI